MGSKVTLNGTLLHPSDYIAAVECKGKDVTLTITKVEFEDLRMHGGGKERKPIVHFKETPKKLVLNKTNADSIAAIDGYGSKAELWLGKRITIYPTKVPFGRNMVDAIRIREVAPAVKNQPRTAPGPAQERVDTSTGEVMTPAADGQDAGQESNLPDPDASAAQMEADAARDAEFERPMTPEEIDHAWDKTPPGKLYPEPVGRKL